MSPEDSSWGPYREGQFPSAWTSCEAADCPPDLRTSWPSYLSSGTHFTTLDSGFICHLPLPLPRGPVLPRGVTQRLKGTPDHFHQTCRLISSSA